MPVSGLVVTLNPPPPGYSPETFQSPPPQSPVMRQSRLAGAASPATTNSAHKSATPAHAAVIEQVQQHPRFQVGELQDNRLPVVIDTPDKQADKDCWAWLNNLPGVHHVDVAFIHFEEADAFAHQSCDANTDRLIAAPTIGET